VSMYVRVLRSCLSRVDRRVDRHSTGEPRTRCASIRLAWGDVARSCDCERQLSAGDVHPEPARAAGTLGGGGGDYGAAAAALAAGDWKAARACFETALERQELPEGLLGLGTALWWVGEADAAVAAHERAYARCRRQPDPLVPRDGRHLSGIRLDRPPRHRQRTQRGRDRRVIRSRGQEPRSMGNDRVRCHVSVTPRPARIWCARRRELSTRGTANLAPRDAW
jgi:hypothetical protein